MNEKKGEANHSLQEVRFCYLLDWQTAHLVIQHQFKNTFTEKKYLFSPISLSPDLWGLIYVKILQLKDQNFSTFMMSFVQLRGLNENT